LSLHQVAVAPGPPRIAQPQKQDCPRDFLLSFFFSIFPPRVAPTQRSLSRRDDSQEEFSPPTLYNPFFPFPWSQPTYWGQMCYDQSNRVPFSPLYPLVSQRPYFSSFFYFGFIKTDWGTGFSLLLFFVLSPMLRLGNFCSNFFLGWLFCFCTFFCLFMTAHDGQDIHSRRPPACSNVFFSSFSRHVGSSPFFIRSHWDPGLILIPSSPLVVRQKEYYYWQSLPPVDSFDTLPFSLHPATIDTPSGTKEFEM